MPLIKTLSQTLKQDKEKFKVPRSAQQAIPIRKIWPDGIFQVESKYSRTFRFTDINYSIASKADKTEMFLDYSELLNALDSGCTAKITLNNRKINKEEFEQSLLIPMKGDGLDEYRKEYNNMLLSKISGTNNSIYQERYLTVSVHKKNIDEARTYFARVGTDIITHLAKLSSIGEELDAEQRLQIFRDFFKADVPQSFPFDIQKLREYDWDDFNAERRFREHQTSLLDCMELLLEEKETKESQPESVEALLDTVENEELLQILLSTDKKTLQMIVLKMMGYAPKEISHHMELPEQTVYTRLRRLREKIKKSMKFE